MLRCILIGLDTPAHATVLTELGIRWARRCGAKLLGLGIVDEPGIRAIEPLGPVGGNPGTDPVYYMGYENRMAEVTRQVADLLAQFGMRCEEAGVPHEEIKEMGTPHEVIESEAQSCDLVLLTRGSRFRFTPYDDEGDETLKKVLKNAPRPVVVLPPKSLPEGTTLIAYDGSLQAARSLAAFEATGLAESGRVHIVTVDANADTAAIPAERARLFLERHGIEATRHPIESEESPADVILEEVDRLEAGLLVMGADGKPLLREFFSGSVTKRLLSECPIPLFFY